MCLVILVPMKFLNPILAPEAAPLRDHFESKEKTHIASVQFVLPDHIITLELTAIIYVPLCVVCNLDRPTAFLYGGQQESAESREITTLQVSHLAAVLGLGWREDAVCLFLSDRRLALVWANFCLQNHILPLAVTPLLQRLQPRVSLSKQGQLVLCTSGLSSSCKVLLQAVGQQWGIRKVKSMPSRWTKLSPFVRSFSPFCGFVPPMLRLADTHVTPIIYKALIQIPGLLKSLYLTFCLFLRSWRFSVQSIYCGYNGIISQKNKHRGSIACFLPAGRFWARLTNWTG